GRIDYINSHAMLNIFIGNNSNRGRGFGGQAVQLALDFAFCRLNLHKVWLQTSARFEAAVKVYKKIGFIKDGVLRHHSFTRGNYEDKVIFSILKDEYVPFKGIS